MTNTLQSQQIISMIMAAGKGSRMKTPGTHKVCHKINGKTVIHNTLETLQQCGIQTNVIIVGDNSEQVIQAASGIDNCENYYCLQNEQRGTGHAAKIGAHWLDMMDYQGAVLILAGDKIIDPDTLLNFVDNFKQSGADLSFMIGHAKHYPSAGRVVMNDQGQAAGIVEIFDLKKALFVKYLEKDLSQKNLDPESIITRARKTFGNEKKAQKALGALWNFLKKNTKVTKTDLGKHLKKTATISLGKTDFSVEHVKNSEYTNQSVYLVKAQALQYALGKLSSDNAQNELYLPDIIHILNSDSYKLKTFLVEEPEKIMAFNTIEELEQIRVVLSKQEIKIIEPKKDSRKVSEWLNIIESNNSDLNSFFNETYGYCHDLIPEKKQRLKQMLEHYKNKFGDAQVVIARTPGRVNLMGRHIEHQGGHCNMIAIDRDLFLVAGTRNDHMIHIENTDRRHFKNRIFSYSELLASPKMNQPWIDIVNSQRIKNILSKNPGDWSHYVKAAAARFQYEYQDRLLKGMNIVVSGDIPIASGLSSSSALVVATSEVIASLNSIKLSKQKFVELCGEGEWFVGTRGGAGDQAAMKFSQKGYVTKIAFFPIKVEDSVRLADDYTVLICNSQIKAQKTAGAKDTFNHRVACYHLAREYIKLKFPQHSEKIIHLRDINTENLNINNQELLNLVKSCPEKLTRKQIIKLFSDDICSKYLSTHSENYNEYPLRNVLMYGLSECQRSKKSAELIQENKIKEFGNLINISHNGDRIVSHSADGTQKAFLADYSDNRLDELINVSQTNGTFCLSNHSGSYSCSIPKIDYMVDLANSVDGVCGAQILGAGLGGCIMVLVQKNASEQLQSKLIENYYQPNNLEPQMLICVPVAGSGTISI